MNILLFGLVSTAQAGWDGGVILTPILGASQYSVNDADSYSARAGGVAGVSYRQKGMAGLHGRTRAVFQQNFGSDIGFREIKMGSYIGPRLGPLDIEIGVDYMYNEFDIPGVYVGTFNAYSVPLRANFDVDLVHMEVAAGPIFILGTDKGETRTGLSKNPIGIGDEFFYMAAASVDVKLASVGLSASQRHTAYGVDTTVGAHVSFLFLGFGSSGHAY